VLSVEVHVGERHPGVGGERDGQLFRLLVEGCGFVGVGVQRGCRDLRQRDRRRQRAVGAVLQRSGGEGRPPGLCRHVVDVHHLALRGSGQAGAEPFLVLGLVEVHGQLTGARNSAGSLVRDQGDGHLAGSRHDSLRQLSNPLQQGFHRVLGEHEAPELVEACPGVDRASRHAVVGHGHSQNLAARRLPGSRAAVEGRLHRRLEIGLLAPPRAPLSDARAPPDTGRLDMPSIGAGARAGGEAASGGGQGDVGRPAGGVGSRHAHSRPRPGLPQRRAQPAA